jgi:hypothetical protein
MAKITITIEDAPNGTVKVTSDPNMETVFKMIDSGHDLTAAHGYAFRALNQIRKDSQNTKEPSKILVPRLGRG